jgi:predicted ATPase
VNHSYFRIRRLRVLRKGRAVYDQGFHSGVNIIRGENGSGKSTIADFIFYILGGEFDNWKTAAADCNQVQPKSLHREASCHSAGTSTEPKPQCRSFSDR